MCRHEVISLYTFKKLAGVSGERYSDEEWQELEPGNERNDACVFTGPRDLATLEYLLNAEEPYCVMLCHNEDLIDDYTEKGGVLNDDERFFVAILAGGEDPDVYSLSRLIELFPQSDLARRYNAGEEIDLRSVYGKTPFQHISPR